ncbi:hypothetical protein KsCSTR_11630 [Candidatus Kuenenia stuttgartiensis]|uniref:Uncharacterized protein n=1 Tax=Kuenenia stuttgartiensis TaxID=174633 RepID=Q1PYE8_KUEST|nr:hypothetical protein KsCSTR_11630 [Candidatus Kuenenia stuttgartiensis]CAJ72102.1 unknown protein [Candidatus Kuenenia stuttgartiensis]
MYFSFVNFFPQIKQKPKHSPSFFRALIIVTIHRKRYTARSQTYTSLCSVQGLVTSCALISGSLINYAE